MYQVETGEDSNKMERPIQDRDFRVFGSVSLEPSFRAKVLSKGKE